MGFAWRQLNNLWLLRMRGVLIHLDELGALDVLSDYDTVYVPNAVWLEVEHHRPEALQHKMVNLVHCPSTVYSIKVNAMSALFTLHHGECEALTLCHKYITD